MLISVCVLMTLFDLYQKDDLDDVIEFVSQKEV